MSRSSGRQSSGSSSGGEGIPPTGQPPETLTAKAKVINIRQRLPRPIPEEKGIVASVSAPPKRFTFSMLVMLIWGLTLIALSPMLVLWLPNASLYLFSQKLVLEPYSLQLACAVLIAGVFGARYGTFIMATYLIAGLLGVAVFSQGGGGYYITNPSFGYIIGLCVIPLMVQQELKKAFKGQKLFRGRVLYLFFSAVIALCVVNGFGLLGLLANALMGSFSWELFFDYFHALTINRIAYDLCSAFVAVLSVRLVRLVFYPCFY